jgi:hypothetical protein
MEVSYPFFYSYNKASYNYKLTLRTVNLKVLIFRSHSSSETTNTSFDCVTSVTNFFIFLHHYNSYEISCKKLVNTNF